MSKILEWDEQLFLWINSFHTSCLDPVMLLMTKTAFWIPLYLVLLYLIFAHYKKEGWLILAGIGLAILLSDQITTTLMKPFFARPRPSHEPGLQGLVHTVNGYEGGLYGFASGHAANTLAIAFFIWLIFRKRSRWTALIFVWAAFMMYTRIYLGVHYPGDILAGMLVGLMGGWIGFRFYRWLKSIRDKRRSVTLD